MRAIRYFSLCLLFSALQASEVTLGDFAATISQDDAARLIRVLAARTFRELPSRFDDIFVAKNGPALLSPPPNEKAFLAFMIDSTVLQQVRGKTYVQCVTDGAQYVNKAADLVAFLTSENREDNLDFDTLFSLSV